MLLPIEINGQQKAFYAEPNELLLDVLRNEGYFGVKRGCADGNCGSCIVLINDIPRKTCIMLIGQAHGKIIVTAEGLGTPDNPHPVHEMFVEEAGVQCGFCIPGMTLAATALLIKTPNPTKDQIEESIEGNLCRCTGYIKQVTAIERAAEILRGGT